MYVSVYGECSLRQAAISVRLDEEAAPRSAPGGVEGVSEPGEVVEQAQPHGPPQLQHVAEVEKGAGDNGAALPQEVVAEVASPLATPPMPQVRELGVSVATMVLQTLCLSTGLIRSGDLCVLRLET